MKLQIFVLILAAAGAVKAGQGKTLTAQQIVSLIQQHSGVAWNGKTVDTFKAGDPNTPVIGIAATMMATFDVLKRASAQGANLIITHEPTFYSHEDRIESFEAANDPVWREKEDFVREHHLVVWRFHDHWHMRRPDGILSGMAQALGWESYERKDVPNLFVLPQTTLRALSKNVQDRIGIKVLRVVGNPDLEVTKVALMPGAAGTERHLQLLRRDDVEVLVIGEVPEWETIEYVSDAAAEGRRKALILMGHIPSEQAGMASCAEWLKTFITGVPIIFVSTAEPFWMP
ncbi:MAG: Nif3-like dinuclear metal center hexameric protein [Bryobacteraceae bacterium]